MIFILSTLKGGEGKTTSAVNLASYMTGLGYNGLLIDCCNDADSLSLFMNIRKDEDVTQIEFRQKSGNIAPYLDKIKNDYDFIIVDTRGGDSRELRTAAQVADIIITPFEPANFGLNTSIKMRERIEEMQDVNPKLKAVAFLNKADTHHARQVETEAAIEFLKENSNYDVLTEVITHSCNYRDMQKVGRSIFELQKNCKKQIQETASLCQKISELALPEYEEMEAEHA